MSSLRRGPTPYYHQISAILREKITNGELRGGDRVPSEDELRKMFGVSRSTVRQALLGLEQDGLVRREPGKGSFVRCAEPRVAELKMTCLLEDLIALGIPAHNVVSEIGVVRASRKVAEALGLAPNDSVFTFLRMIAVEDEPFAAHRIFLPAWMERCLDENDLADQHMLTTLSKKCGVQPDTADQMIEAVMADANQANLLDVSTGSALLCVTRTAYDRQKNPLEYSVTLYRSDRTRFFISQRQRRTESSDWVLSARGPRGAEDPRATLRGASGKRPARAS